MHAYYFIAAVFAGGITTYLYRDWAKATTPGAVTRISLMFVIGVIIPVCVTPYSHPDLGESGWPNYPDYFMASSVVNQILFFVGFGLTAWIRPRIHFARIS